jgi:hypothetical protein
LIRNGAQIETLARRAEDRAVRARRHASIARSRALDDAQHGNIRHELMHSREAELHERAATLQEETAALHRQHARHMTAESAQIEPGVEPGV